MNHAIDTLLTKNNTAFYVFDIAKLKRRIQYLRDTLPEAVSLCYAVKANTFLIKEISDEIDRFEVCSPGEAEICNTLDIPSRKLVISGVYKTPFMIENLIKDPTFQGILTVESLRQYELLRQLSAQYHHTIPILLRLTNDSQFGMNKEDIEQIVSTRKTTPNLDILGIQFFSGTQKTSIKKLKRELTHLDAFLQHLTESCGFEARELEYGPGFPVTYFEEETFDEDAFLRNFSMLLHDMNTRPKITLELGRSIAASCGQYFTHIVDKKQNKQQNYVLVDGGMHQLVYYGQHMAMKHPFLSVYGKEHAPKTASWNICGSLCTMNDIIVKQAALPDFSIGDVLCFQNTGAYSITEGISLFLSRDLPAVYLLKENEEIISVRNTQETAVWNTPNYERKFSIWNA